MYDFQVFGYYAPAIAATFFPATSPYVSLLLSFMTFGAGFLMRPLGAIVLGTYMDHRGRRAGLLLSLASMAIGTLAIACLPGYATLGIAAPLLVLAGRLLQGFSAGAELGGVSVYLFEIAPSQRQGFYVSWQSASQQVAVMLAAVLALVLGSTLDPARLEQWGWRLALLAGCALLPVFFYLRRSLEETPAFQARPTRPGPREIVHSLARNWLSIGLGTGMSLMTIVSFYLATTFTPTYGTTVLHLESTGVLSTMMCVGALSLLVLPLSGALSDCIGRRPILIVCSLATLFSVYPALLWLVAQPSLARLLLVELWFAFLYAAYTGAVGVYVIEMMPPEIRTVGFALAHSLAGAIFGGFTPAIATYLIHATGNAAAPGLWLSLAALAALGCAIGLGRRRTPLS